MRPISFGSYSFNGDGVGILENDPGFDMQSQLIVIARADGAYDGFGSGQSPSAARKYSVKFFIAETGSLKVDQQFDLFVTETRKGLQSMRVLRHDGTYRIALMKCVGVKSQPRASANLVHLEVTALFEMAEPYWYADSQTTTTVAVSATPTACDLTNLGTAPLIKAILRYTGTANRPKWTNNTNGFSVELNRNISSSKVVEIDLAKQTVTYDGADDFANLVLSATQIGMFKFDVGANDIDFTAAGGGTPSGTVEFIYRWMYD